MKRYTDELKNTIIRQSKSGKSLKELHYEYDIPKSTISTWIKNDNRKYSHKQNDSTLKERELEREIYELKEENNILKNYVKKLFKYL